MATSCPGSEGSEEPEECAICFNPLAEDERLPLPCSCNIQYCPACWDRALAAAFNDSGQARCPTCRTQVRVDFDPDGAGGGGRLVFSRAEPDPEGVTPAAQAEARAETVNRLAGQGAPLMARNLREYGERHPHLRWMATDPAGYCESTSLCKLRRVASCLGGELAGYALPAGVRVRLFGLAAKPELNGQRGTVGRYHQGKGRHEVQLDGGAARIMIKPTNLRLEEQEAPLAEGGAAAEDIDAAARQLDGRSVHSAEKSRLLARMTTAAGGVAELALWCAECETEAVREMVRASHEAEGVAAAGLPRPSRAAAVLAADPAVRGSLSFVGPRCVCGGQLCRLEGRERLLRLIAEQAPQLVGYPEQMELILGTISGTSHLICDLCDEPVQPGKPVFTCDNGSRTILHATAYDVCEACCVRYAVHGLGDEGLAAERRLT